MADLTAAQLVGAQLCTAQCLLGARPPGTCGCPCRGRWHGVLAAQAVPGSAAFREPLPAPQPGPHLLDELAAHNQTVLAT